MYSYIPKKQYPKLPRALSNIAFLLTCLLICVFFADITHTNAYFKHESKIDHNEVSTGHWIPKLKMEIDPSEPDGKDGWYASTPCITLSSSITDSDETEIFYTLSGKKDVISEKYEGSCIKVPDGEWAFSAFAIYDGNENWKSNEVSQSFKVDKSAVSPGDVVINEVMWMGSFEKEKDQWVELRNISDKNIHMKDWYLTYESNSGKETPLLEIKDDRVIKKGKYFLAAYYSKNNSAIDVNPDSDDMKNFGYKKFRLRLYSNVGRLIDTAGKGIEIPPKGDSENFFSMQRTNEPGDGTDWTNWKTCRDILTTEKYWDTGSTERGTPGADNSYADEEITPQPKLSNSSEKIKE